MSNELSDRRRGLVQGWADFVEGGQQRHLVFGATTSIARWRQKGILRLVDAHHPGGQFAFKRDLDDARGRYVILVAFEQEGDAQALAQSVGAEPMDDYAGFASQRGFTLDVAAGKKIREAVKRLGASKRLLPH
jgi:hypothetical protein